MSGSGVAPNVIEAYDASSITFRVLRAYGWGPLLNLGWFPFRPPFSPLNLVLTPLAFAPRLRLPAAQLALVKRSLELLDPAVDDDVLDVACGRGASSFALANGYPTTQVTGIDLLSQNVQVARTMYGNAPNLRYLEGDATRLEFSDASFDRLLCLESAFHFSDRTRFLAETRRVLRPQGRAAIIDFMADDDVDPALWETDEGQIVRQTWQFSRFATLTAYRADAADAGLDVVAVRNWTAHVTGPIQSLFNLVAWMGRSRVGRRALAIHNPMLRALDPADWEAFDRAAKAHKLLRAHSRYVALVLSPSAP